MRTHSLAIAFALGLLATACSEPPADGAVLIAANTFGGDEDPDGYMLVLDGQSSHYLTGDGEITIRDLEPGPHEVRLDGVEPNCDVSPGTTVNFVVPEGRTAYVGFDVHCYASGISMLSTIEGIDAGPFYTIRLDGVSRPELLMVGEGKTITGLTAGPHLIELDNVPDNCIVSPQSLTVSVTLRSITEVTFSSRCTATHGAVAVDVQVTGRDVDLDGFNIVVDGQIVMAVGGNDGATQEPVSPGTHEVRLDDVAANCTVTGDHRQSVLITAGGMTRDTSRLSFAVHCQRLWGLAFVREGAVALATANGATVDLGPVGSRPAWSPDGSRLAWSCNFICIADMDSGPRLVSPTSGLTVNEPAWSRDGTRLAFVAQLCTWYGYYYYYSYCEFRGLYLTVPNGTAGDLLGLPAHVTNATSPAWSPDGSRIAFGCVLVDAGPQKICSVRRDGTDFRQITPTGGLDGYPSWSPDGSRLIFGTSRFGNAELATVNPDGTDFRRFSTPVAGQSPQWLLDGRILFASGSGGIAIVNADGTGLVRLTTAPGDSLPALRP